MLIVGPTGAGKSVLLALMAMQFRRYPDSQVYIFDKGNSARAAVLAMGGAHHDLGSGRRAGVPAIARIDDARRAQLGRGMDSGLCWRMRSCRSRRK